MLNIDRWLPLLVIVVLTSPSLAIAQARDLVNELNDARRIFVPVEDLDVIIERDKQGVLLPRAKFDVLLTQARANSEKNALNTGGCRLRSRNLRGPVIDHRHGRFDAI